MGPGACRRLVRGLAAVSRGSAEFLVEGERLQPKVGRAPPPPGSCSARYHGGGCGSCSHHPGAAFPLPLGCRWAREGMREQLHPQLPAAATLTPPGVGRSEGCETASKELLPPAPARAEGPDQSSQLVVKPGSAPALLWRGEGLEGKERVAIKPTSKQAGGASSFPLSPWSKLMCLK